MENMYNKEKRKSAILSYLDKNPLSTMREIADNYTIKRANYRVAKNTVEELTKEEKIAYVNHKKIKSYFLEPDFSKINETLLKIISSDKIFLTRFKTLPYQPWNSEDTFSQTINNLINHLHLNLKLFLRYRKRRIKTRLSKKQKQKLTLLFHKNTIKYWKSWQKLCRPQPYSKKSFLEMLTATISILNEELEKKYRFNRPINKISLKRLLELMNAKLEQNNYGDSADLHGRSIKNVRKLLKPLTDEQDKFSPYNAHDFKELEGDGFGPDPEIVKLMLKSNYSLSDIQNYICYSLNIIAFDDEGIELYNAAVDSLIKELSDTL